MVSEEIRAIILAAGKGTRMKTSLPKVMHSILGKTLLERVINAAFKVEEINKTYVIVGYQADTVTEYITSKYPSEQVKTVLQEPQLGTGDAVFKVFDYLTDFDGSVIVLCGDTPLIRTETLEKFILSHKNSGAVLTVMTAILANPTNYGRIIRDENDLIRKIVEEKDATPSQKAIKEINAGIYCFDWQKIAPAFFDLTTDNEQGEYYLTDIIDWAVSEGYKTNAYILEDNQEVFGINSQKQLAEASKILRNRKLQELMASGVTIIDPKNTWISPETSIKAETLVYPGCYIEGQNCFGKRNVIGPNTFIKGNVITQDNVKIIQSRVSDAKISANVTVGPFANIRDKADIGESVRIGNFVEIKNSAINKNSNVSHLSYIGDAELGKDVNIGAGTITANYNALTKEKSKTIISDGVKTGSNSVLVAPLVIDKNAHIGAGSVITKDVPKGALAVTRAPLSILKNWVTKKLKDLKNLNK